MSIKTDSYEILYRNRLGSGVGLHPCAASARAVAVMICSILERRITFGISTFHVLTGNIANITKQTIEQWINHRYGFTDVKFASGCDLIEWTEPILKKRISVQLFQRGDITARIHENMFVIFDTITSEDREPYGKGLMLTALSTPTVMADVILLPPLHVEWPMFGNNETYGPHMLNRQIFSMYHDLDIVPNLFDEVEQHLQRAATWM